jgi:hypothetical protein
VAGAAHHDDAPSNRCRGGAGVLAWGAAFGHVTLALAAGALAFWWLRPADLAGARGPTAAPRAAGT